MTYKWILHTILERARASLSSATVVVERLFFTGVCLSTGAGLHPPGRHRRHPPRQTPPTRQTATAANGTHPTGMHSCFTILLTPVAQLFSDGVQYDVAVEAHVEYGSHGRRVHSRLHLSLLHAMLHTRHVSCKHKHQSVKVRLHRETANVKPTSLLDGFWGNSICYSHRATAKIKETLPFAKETSFWKDTDTISTAVQTKFSLEIAMKFVYKAKSLSLLLQGMITPLRGIFSAFL